MKKIFFMLLIPMLFVSCSKSLTVEEVNVGDIVMTDGSVLTVEEFPNYKGKEKPVAVIFRIIEGVNGRIIGVGLDQKEEPVPFAYEDTKAFTINFKSTSGGVINQRYDPSTDSYKNDGFLGSKSGKENWQKVKKVIKSSGLKNSEFPAYEFALDYKKSRDLGKYKDEWYLPSIENLWYIYENKDIINNAFRVCGVDELYDVLFWSSSQFFVAYDSVFAMYMDDGEVIPNLKDHDAYVLAVHDF
ncbi:MAG: hypothetical protein HUK25_09635 [Treponema sp.]|nr:hypothetical protein [Treponema sp.]